MAKVRLTKSGEKYKVKQPTMKGYRSYVEAYNSKKDMMNKHMARMHLDMLTPTQWVEQYKAEKHRLEIEVKNGTRKAVGNVNQVIVSRQAYPVSRSQARALMVAAEKTGQKLSLSQIRRGGFDWFEINKFRLEEVAKNPNIDYKTLQLLVAQNFFGSE